MSALGWLVILHFLADFPLQGDFLAKAKNHKAPLPGVPWLVCLLAHAAIAAGAVGVILPAQYAILEFIVHTTTDWAKNEGLLGPGERGFAVDQVIHVACKALWWSLA